MNFLNPLGLLFLLSVPLLVMLYFLKLKRPEVTVASTLLWQKVIEDMRVNSPFQRLRKSLLLLLQLLLLLALIFALARPFLKGEGDRDSSIIVLVDTSASMSAREPDGRTRLAHAADRVRELADNLGRNEELMIISFNNQAEQVIQFSTNKRRLREAVDSLTPTDRPTDIRRALALAKSIAESREKPRILLLSDGAFPEPGQVDLRARVEYEMIGTLQPNIAITGLDIRRDTRDRRRIEMFVAVQNFGSTPTKATMNVYLDNRLLDSKPFEIAADDVLSQIFEADLPEGGNVKVEFAADDALKEDNVAWQIVEPPRQRRLLLVGNNTYFLERAFASAPDTIVSAIAPEAYTPSAADGCTAVIWNLVPNPAIAPTHNLYIGCVPEVPKLGIGESVKSPAIDAWDKGHPVTRFIDFSDLLVQEALTLKIPDEARVVLSSTATPLIVDLPHEQHELLIVGFNSYQSNWPLLVSFPIFLHNTVNWFESLDSTRISSNVAVGSTMLLGKQSTPPSVTLPSGKTIALNVASSEQYSFSGVDRTGVYTVHTVVNGEKLDRQVSANLFDPRESNLATVSAPIVDGERTTSVELRRQVDHEYGRYLLMAALVLLLGEWYIYHKRIFT